MRVWAGLYAMVWVVLVELLVAIDPVPPGWLIYLHAGLGCLIIVLAVSNYVQVRATTAPGRTKRTVRATLGLSVLMAALGFWLWLNLGASTAVAFGYTVWDLVHVLHVLNAIAIIAQAASAATAYDMWEEKEFAVETRPGEVPPLPTPQS